jgi:LysM repeat protein
MASLNAHLVETGDHGRLGFHPACPVCRQQRLFGPLPAEAVISRRAQAALASGVLAISAAAPAASPAQAPQQPDAGAPAQPDAGAPVPPDAGVGPLGSDSGVGTALPLDAAPLPAAPGSGGDADAGGGGSAYDSAPVEAEPVVDTEAGLAPPPRAGTQVPAPGGTVPAPGETVPAPGGTVPAPGETVPAPGGAAPPAPAPPTRDVMAPPLEGDMHGAPDSSQPGPERSQPDQQWERKPRTTRGERTARTPLAGETGAGGDAESVGTSPSGIADAAPPVSAVPADQPVLVAQASTPEQAAGPIEPLPRDVRSHVVEPGESLWWIARRLLEPGASAARVAREVARLWELNADRIGTGDPDLLMIGTRLRLR